MNEVIRNGAPISCHDDAAPARSMWTSAAVENAPIERGEQEHDQDRRRRPALGGVAHREDRDEPAAAGGDPAEDAGAGSGRAGRGSARRRCRRGPERRRRAGPRPRACPCCSRRGSRARGGATPRRSRGRSRPRRGRAGGSTGPRGTSSASRAGVTVAAPPVRAVRTSRPIATTADRHARRPRSAARRRPAAGRSRGAARARPSGRRSRGPRRAPPASTWPSVAPRPRTRASAGRRRRAASIATSARAAIATAAGPSATTVRIADRGGPARRRGRRAGRAARSASRRRRGPRFRVCACGKVDLEPPDVEDRRRQARRRQPGRVDEDAATRSAPARSGRCSRRRPRRTSPAGSSAPMSRSCASPPSVRMPTWLIDLVVRPERVVLVVDVVDAVDHASATTPVDRPTQRVPPVERQEPGRSERRAERLRRFAGDRGRDDRDHHRLARVSSAEVREPAQLLRQRDRSASRPSARRPRRSGSRVSAPGWIRNRTKVGSFVSRLDAGTGRCRRPWTATRRAPAIEAGIGSSSRSPSSSTTLSGSPGSAGIASPRSG